MVTLMIWHREQRFTGHKPAICFYVENYYLIIKIGEGETRKVSNHEHLPLNSEWRNDFHARFSLWLYAKDISAILYYKQNSFIILILE